MKVSNSERHSDRAAIFASPIRTLRADEIETVSGGGPFEGNYLKDCGGVDNHSKEM